MKRCLVCDATHQQTGRICNRCHEKGFRVKRGSNVVTTVEDRHGHWPKDGDVSLASPEVVAQLKSGPQIKVRALLAEKMGWEVLS